MSVTTETKFDLFGTVAVDSNCGDLGVITSKDDNGVYHGVNFHGHSWSDTDPQVINGTIGHFVRMRFLSIKCVTELLNRMLRENRLDVKSEQGRESTRLMVNVLNEAFQDYGRINGLINDRDEWVEFTFTIKGEQ